MSLHRFPGVLVAGVLFSAPHASAQWSSDPAVNFSVADGASDQTQPKVIATSDGGVFVSWFDGIGTGYDVRVQRLDALGNEGMAHGGVLVADRGFSSTQDYGISIDPSDNVLLVFRDDRPGGTQITAAKVDANGTAAWGAAGVQLTSTASFVASPRIAGTSDGGAVVAWTQDSSTRLQKLDSSGTPQWAGDVVLTPAAGTYSIADLHAAGTDVIASLVHQTGNFLSPKQLVTQKFDPNGVAQWAGSVVQVFNTGSLQFGNFPGFTPDGSGGAVFAWYQTSPLQVFVQRILANGTEAFPTNGVAVSLNAAQARTDPAVSFLPATGETVVSWVETNLTQSQFGVSSQKLDAAGNRLWGANGVAHVPLGAAAISNVRHRTTRYTTLVFWVDSPSFGQGVLNGLRADASGATDIGPFGISTTSSSKSRLAVAGDTSGQAILVWTDGRIDAGDIYGQNVHCEGTLGPASTTAAWTDVGNSLAGFSGPPLLQGEGTLCHGAEVTLTLTSARPSSSALLVLGLSDLSAPFQGGVLVPFPDLILPGLPTGPSGSIVLSGALPQALPPQLDLYLQFWILDAAGPRGFAASNALRATVP